MKALFSLASTCIALTATVAAQPQLVNIADPLKGTAYTAGSSLHRMAVSTEGHLYAVMKLGKPLVLYKSTDGGTTWKNVASDTTGGNPSGQAIVTGAVPHILHVGFHAEVGGKQEAPYYRAYNTKTDSWVGPAELVFDGATTTQDWRLADIEVTQMGTIVVAFKSPSKAPTGFKNSAGHICVKQAGSKTWSKPIQVSTGGNGSGLRNQLHAIGEIVHMTYRYSSGGHNVTYRAFDTTKMSFVGAQVVIDGPKATPASEDITNYHTMCFDDDNRCYVVYGVGDTGTLANGEYKLAWADAPYAKWTTAKIADDKQIKGKTDSKHLSVVHTTGNQIHVLYSKKSAPETLNNLYTREWKNGAFTPEVKLLTRTSNTFHTIWGYRSQTSNTGFVAFIHDESPASGRNMWYLNNSGKAGRTHEFGATCKGNRSDYPYLSTSRMPEAGKIVPFFQMTMGRMPKNSAGVLFLGVNALAKGIDLGGVGAGGCQLIMDPMLVWAGFTTNANGKGMIPISIPAKFAGATANFQAFVLAPGANTAGFLLSHGLVINP